MRLPRLDAPCVARAFETAGKLALALALLSAAGAGAAAEDGAGPSLTVFANGFIDRRDAMGATAEVTHLLGRALSADHNGDTLAMKDGSLVFANRFGDFQFTPNGAFDHLDPGEHADVAVPWRQAGDAADRSLTVRVLASAEVGPDLARGVTPRGTAPIVYPLLAAVTAGEVVEVSYAVTGRSAGSVAARLGATGTPGAPQAVGGRRTVDYIRAPEGGATELHLLVSPDFNGVVRNLRARVVATPGEPAAIRRLKAARVGGALDLVWAVTPAAGLPDTSDWLDIGGAPGAPLTIDAATEPKRLVAGEFLFRTPEVGAARVHLHDYVLNGARGVAMTPGFRDFLAIDGEAYGPFHARAGLGAGFNLWTRATLDNGSARIYDQLLDWGLAPERDFRIANTDGVDGDMVLGGDGNHIAGLRNFNYDTWILGCEFRNFSDAALDMKGAWWGNMLTLSGGFRSIRQWVRNATAARTAIVEKPANFVVWLGQQSARVRLWMTDLPGGVRARAAADVEAAGGVGTGLGAKAGDRYDATAQQLVVMHTVPRLPPEVRVNATDFAFEGSADGGRTWAPLAVPRTGLSDAWGAPRRRLADAPPALTHVRARALWGARAGAWAVAAITDP